MGFWEFPKRKTLGNLIGKVVNLPGKPINTENIIVAIEEDEEISMHALLVAKDDDYLYLLRVVDIFYYSPLATPQDSKTALVLFQKNVTPEEAMGHFQAFRAVRTELLDVAIKEEEEFRLLGPKKIPKPLTPVYRPSSESYKLLYGYQRNPVTVGKLIDSDVEATIDVQNLSRHLLVIGTTGTGKSWFRGVLLERLYDMGVPQLVFDPLRDYVVAVEDLGGVNLRYGRDYLPDLSTITEGSFANMLIDVLTPLQLSIALKGFRKFKMAVINGKHGPEPAKLLDYIEEAAEDMRARDETRGNVLGRIEVLLREMGYDTERRGILAYSGSAENILTAEKLGKMLNDKLIVNIDLRGVGDLGLQTTVASSLSQLRHLREKDVVPPLIVSFDEAHRIAPRGKGSSPALPIVKDTIRFGRHYGIGVIAITQFPDSVDIELIRLPTTRLIFAVDADQIGAVSGLLGDLPESLRRHLPKLERGTAFLAGTVDVVRHTLYVRISSERRTKHGGETPQFRVRYGGYRHGQA